MDWDNLINNNQKNINTQFKKLLKITNHVNKLIMFKKALIFGITGQDGSYLAKLLLKKYEVHGVKRRSSLINTDRIDDIYEDINTAKKFFLHYGDVTDSLSVNKII